MMLETLHLKDVGPASDLSFVLAPRLNILTGDNGLGKTFILDIVWWALTWTWAGNQAMPHPKAARYNGPKLNFKDYGYLTSEIEYVLTPGTRRYDLGYVAREQRWARRPPITATGDGVDRLRESPFPGDGLVIYSRIDGSFSVWDAMRNQGRFPNPSGTAEERPKAYHFSSKTIWNGLEDGSNILCNGLIRDWVSWQIRNNGAFQKLTEILHDLSPTSDDDPSPNAKEMLVPGDPTRVSLDDVRDIPTLKMPYGDVPLTHASAGIRRIAAIGYVLVWAWQEHLLAARRQRQDPTRELTILVDEIEAHLHPEWQRRILPALVKVVQALGTEANVQVFIGTHSPLVLASLEPTFKETMDSLFHLGLAGSDIYVHDIKWTAQGDIVNWLVSEVFGLEQARSLEAERAIEAAERFMAGETSELRDGLRTKEEIHRELIRLLPGHDHFWPRWVVFRDKGVI